jgi:preprotein translocase subunit SecG
VVLDDEQARGLAGRQGSQLLDLFDLGGGLGVDAQFFGLISSRTLQNDLAKTTYNLLVNWLTYLIMIFMIILVIRQNV